MNKKRSNAEEDEEFSNRETPPKASDLNKNKPSAQRLALTQGTIDDSYESDSSQSEKVEDEPSSPRPHSRKIFSSNYAVVKTRKAHSLLPPGISYPTIRFDPIQDVVDIDREGDLPVHEQAKEKGTNPYRRWGAHRALCDNASGGFLVERTDGKVTKVTRIEPQSGPPPEPKSPIQVTMAKMSGESQTLLGSLKVQPGDAENECKRIAEEMDRISWMGGFKDTPIPKKEKKNSDEKDDEKENRRLIEKVRKKQPSKKPDEKKKNGTNRKIKGSRRKRGSDSNTASGSTTDSGSKGKSKSTDESAENTDEDDVGKTKRIKNKIKSLLSLSRSKNLKKKKSKT